MPDNATKPNDARVSPRVQMAEDYFEKDFNLRGQRSWYSKHASINKQCYQWLGLAIIVAGAAMGIIQIWAPIEVGSDSDGKEITSVHWTSIAAALLGALVVISKGIERIWDFDGTWLGYRKASEAMKREKRLFVNGAMVYEHCVNDHEAFLLFIKRVEGIITEEQNNFMGNHESNTNPSTENNKKEDEE